MKRLLMANTLSISAGVYSAKVLKCFLKIAPRPPTLIGTVTLSSFIFVDSSAFSVSVKEALARR